MGVDGKTGGEAGVRGAMARAVVVIVRRRGIAMDGEDRTTRRGAVVAMRRSMMCSGVLMLVFLSCHSCRDSEV